jgi:hypothetical protein
MAAARAALVLVLAAPLSLVAQPLDPSALDWATVLTARRPSAEELAAQGLLAEAGRAAAGGASRVAEAPSLAVAGGPRRDGGGEARADLAVELELPLLAGRGARADLAVALERLAGPLATGARAGADADLAAAFVDVWLAQASLEVRAADLAAAEEWLAATRRRVEAGADPPYEPTLVAGERDRALLELLAVRRELELAWGDLAARADLAPAPQPVTLTGFPDPPAGLDSHDAAAAAIAAREELALALARARAGSARSRWAVAAEVGSEGEERLAHVGLSYRFALPGERGAVASELRAAEDEARRAAQGERAALRARLAAARSALAATAGTAGETELQRAQDALTVRLAEGKERASAILPLRRQLLEARLAHLAARAAVAKATAELHFLGGSADAL